MSQGPSNSQVKKAGSTVRKYLRGERITPEAVDLARETIEAWRRTHYTPLVSANNGLRSMARTARVDAEVTQRLKRRQTILDKLRREPTLDLSRMQDIGGCRAVVDTIDELRRLEGRIRQIRRPVNDYDYIASPRASGYRAVHLVVTYQGRPVEIQLRTRVMHTWALAVEAYSETIASNLKQDGTHPVQQFLESASRIMALQEQGEPVPNDLQDEHDQRRLLASPLLLRGHNHE